MSDLRYVVIMADHDDPDVEEAVGRLNASGANVFWLRLGLDYHEYSVLVSDDGAEVRTTDGLVDEELMANASAVVFRRWKVAPPFPIVEARLPGDPERFAEREWAATFRVLLSRWREVSEGARWSRDPFATADKVGYLRQLAALGASVPASRIVSQPTPAQVEQVSKAIGSDQAVIRGHRYATTLIQRPEMDYLFEGPQPCPVLIQDAIDVDHEIRIGYSFGKCGAVAQRRLDDRTGPVDIRYDEVNRSQMPLPLGMGTLLQRFAEASELNVFTADVLIDTNGKPWIIDVNPDGLFIAADDTELTLMGILTDGVSSLLAIDHPIRRR